MPKKKTQEEFEKDVSEKLGKDYILLSPYPGGHGKVKMKHLKCNNEFLKNVHDIITKKSGCPYCNGSQPAKYNEQWVKDNTPLPYHYISGYTGMAKSKCLFHCDICNKDFLQFPNRLINQKIYGCDCQINKKWTHQDFLNNLGEECLNEYEILEEYQNTDIPISFKHKECRCEFKLSPYKFIYRYNKHYCPICYYKKSHGEIFINLFLTKNNIEYQKEFIFPNLPNRKFDFYIPSENIVIEFDGEQHFHSIDFFGGDENFKSLQKRDQEKNQYCINNNIILFRIPYTEIDNINQILTEIFKEKSSTTIEKFLITEQSTLQVNGNGNG